MDLEIFVKHEIHLEPFYVRRVVRGEDTTKTRWCAWTHREGLDWKCDRSTQGDNPDEAVTKLLDLIGKK